MKPEKKETLRLLDDLRVASANLSVCRGRGDGDPAVSNRWALDAVESQLTRALEALAGRDFVGGPVRLVMLQDAVERLRRRGMTREDHSSELSAKAQAVRAAGAAFAADAAAVSAFSSGFHAFLAGFCARSPERVPADWKDNLAFFGAFRERVLTGAFGDHARPVIEAVDQAFTRTYARREGLRREAAARYLARPEAPTRSPKSGAPSKAEFLLFLPYLAVPVGVMLLVTSLIPGGWGVGVGVPLALLAFFAAGTLYTPQLIVLLLFALALWAVVKALVGLLS
ncbi:MAG: hypothetical protein FD126_358 [Elusimicrobia bacterium]|nr:MAG: hypothetical protein FD126_358 [Elusimicrobiota bacterium]